MTYKKNKIRETELFNSMKSKRITKPFVTMD